ncbi:MAG: hypothetical protein V2J02_19955 [Pseudomonadales bacterium]|jgi:hypothetical protein|nr:hypothetical protein [Pseudomonadales bacterium]
MTGKSRAQPAGPKALTGSVEAKRKTAVILEALAGLRTTQQASEELGIALVRYYVLETRMLQAMIDALEPRARGRKRDESKLRDELETENRRLRREVARLQALYRTAQRAVGVKAPEKSARVEAKTAKARRPRKQSRGERVLSKLHEQLSGSAAASATIAGTAKE